MSLFQSVLDSLEDATSCSGTYRPPEGIAIALPDGDVGAADDSKFVDWLLAHSEPAPFGHNGETKLDKNVRAADRLTVRDKATVVGVDSAALLDQIEATLSPTFKLSATLTDVLVYQKGGKFLTHKDTPRSPDLVGTLIVGLPIAHTGGEFVVNDGSSPVTYDWSGKADPAEVRWVALFSDVDHEIKPVKSGARVTLVYALHRTATPRTDKAATTRRELIKSGVKELKLPKGGTLMIACGRHAIAEANTLQPMDITTLRGADRDIADALVEAGFGVAVRACIAAVGTGWGDDAPAATSFPSLQNMFELTRLKAVPPMSVISELGDEVYDPEIDDYRLDSVRMDQCVFRKAAVATLAYENASWAEPGNFGNEDYQAHLYTIAALEVTKTKPKLPKPGTLFKRREPEPEPEPEPAPKPKATPKKATAKKSTAKKPVKKTKTTSKAKAKKR